VLPQPTQRLLLEAAADELEAKKGGPFEPVDKGDGAPESASAPEERPRLPRT
jgi:hypothetical protein